MPLNRSHPSRKIFFRACLLFCFLYWTYLAGTTQFHLIYDSENYESFGRELQDKGWPFYFETGPNREPVYLALIAASVAIAKFLSVPYDGIQVLIQLSLMALTLWLVLKILRTAGVSPAIQGLCALAMAVSPAMTNATFGLISEIAAFPLIVWLVLTYAACLRTVSSGAPDIKPWIVLGLNLLALTFVKAVFQLIFFLLIIPLIAFMVFHRKRMTSPTIRPLIFGLLALIVIYKIPLETFKYANYMTNGQYTLTDRGPWAVYGNTARRMEPLTKERFLTALAFVPGWGVCHYVFGPEPCAFWSYQKSDDLAARKMNELSNLGLTRTERDRRLIQETLSLIRRDPPQYILLSVLEGAKFLFWGSMESGYAVLPRPLMKIYSHQPTRLALFFILPPLTLMALIALFAGAVRSAKRLTRNPNDLSSQNEIYLSLAIIIVSYIAAHTPFFVVARYGFPLAPLYVTVIGLMFSMIANTFQNRVKTSRGAEDTEPSASK